MLEARLLQTYLGQFKSTYMYARVIGKKNIYNIFKSYILARNCSSSCQKSQIADYRLKNEKY